MISYEKFRKYMTKIMEQDERDNKFSDALVAFCTDGAPFVTTTELAIDLLEELCDDTQDHWITYWLYELDRGFKYTEGCVTMDDINVPMETLEDLYKVLRGDYWVDNAPAGYKC